MTPYNRIFQLHAEGKNNSEIVRIIGDVSRKTVITALQLADELKFVYSSEKAMSDTEIHRALHPKKNNANRVPNMEKAIFMIGLPEMSIAKVWAVYCDDCKNKGVSPYSKAQFQNLVNDAKKHIVMPEYKSILAFRYIANVIERAEQSYGLLAAEVMGSNYVVATLISNKKTRTWIHGLINIIRQLKYVPNECVFVSHLSSSIKSQTEDCLQFYGMTLKERDKNLQTHLPEIMESIIREYQEQEEFAPSIFVARTICNKHNSDNFSKSNSFTIHDAFSTEKHVLHKIPFEDYNLVEFRTVSPQFNHVQIDRMYYSIPFEFRHEKLTAYVSEYNVEIHRDGNVVCVHDRLTGRPGQYRTIPEHLPRKEDIPWNEPSGKSFRKWADKIGPYTRRTIDYWLNRALYESQAYKMCNTVLHLSSKYTSEVLESACKAAWEHNAVSYHFIAESLKNN